MSGEEMQLGSCFICEKCGASRFVGHDDPCDIGFSTVECRGRKNTPSDTPKSDGGGLRYDGGKVRVELLPPEWIWALAEVTTRGSLKYEERNWERGMPWSKMIGCAFRHTLKFIFGEVYDKETGCHHLAMAAWNILALMTYHVRGIGSNDLVGEMEWMSRVVNRSLDDVKREIGAAKSKS